ncbi:DUF748 domain-containing protein [Kushneria sp. AK178]
MALRHRNRWLIGAAAAATLGLSTWLLCTWGATAYANRALESALGRPATIEEVAVNPFTATVSLQGLALGATNERILTVSQGSASFHWASLWQSGLHIDEVSLNGTHLRLITDASGELNLAQLGGSSEDDSMAIVIDRIRVANGQLDWIDRRTSPHGKLSLRDMTVSLEDYNSETPEDPMHGSASARLGEGRLEVGGDFSPDPLTGDLQVTAGQLALAQLNPWLSDMRHLQIDSGKLTGQGRLAFGRAAESSVLWQGDIDIGDLSVLDHRGDHIFSVNAAAFNGMDIQGADYLQTERITLEAPVMLVLLDEQGQLNLTAQPDSADEEAPASESSDASSQEADSDQEAGSSDQGADLALGSLRVNDATFRFEDRQMSPVVQLDIRSLSGRMEAFDTRTQAPARFSFKGFESDDTPVAIEGNFSAGASMAGEMTLTSERLPLERFAPYVQRFGGYRIRSGIADLDLHYQLEQGRVSARNHVVLRRLALAEEADGSDISLPLKRLIGLLQGDEGVIDLNIPIEATVDGGEVDISSVVMQVVGEVLENLATSPIETLDAMINGDDNDTAGAASKSYTEGPLSHVATEPREE